MPRSHKGEGERAALVGWGALRVLASGVGCLARQTPHRIPASTPEAASPPGEGE